ncbi:YceD family protein [Roseovarius tibetensis]|uniref:YceD family protein n=1 Tax=Roseovarius tibetensis TaxID=2685897 RepID=UPI003D7F7D00
MSDAKRNDEVLRVAHLRARGEHSVELTPDAGTRRMIAEELGLSDLRKLRLSGRITADGPDWVLDADLGATVVQPCVVTLSPVTTRIDEPVTRRFSPEADRPEDLPGDEMEMPEDDTVEPLEHDIDLRRVMIEALSLALPPWPRRDGAELDPVTAAAEGVVPLTDEDTKPFAGLAGLRDKLGTKE